MAAELCRNGHPQTMENQRVTTRFRASRGHYKHYECTKCSIARRNRRAEETRANGEVDDVVIERLVCGEHEAGSTSVERRIAVDILTKRGVCIRETALLVGITERTVSRIRKTLKRDEA